MHGGQKLFVKGLPVVAGFLGTVGIMIVAIASVLWAKGFFLPG